MWSRLLLCVAAVFIFLVLVLGLVVSLATLRIKTMGYADAGPSASTTPVPLVASPSTPPRTEATTAPVVQKTPVPSDANARPKSASAAPRVPDAPLPPPMKVAAATPPLPAEPARKVRSNTVITLTASAAELRGRAILVEQIDGAPTIGHWEARDNAVRWWVEPPEDGLYEVELTYAYGEARPGGEYELMVSRGDDAAAETRWPGRVQPTGGWGVFKEHALGPIPLGHQRTLLTLHARPGGDFTPTFMNVRSLRLRPAGG